MTGGGVVGTENVYAVDERCVPRVVENNLLRGN